MPVIDFENSRMEWRTRAEQSSGFWQIEAALRIHDSRNDDSTIYALAPAVSAGNLYSKPMIVIPPYEFRFLASESNFMMLRHLYDQNKTSIETGEIDSLFSHFTIHWNLTPSVALSQEQVMQSASMGNKLVATVSATENELCSWHATFPVKHINVNNTSTNFQIETGPVLIYRHREHVKESQSVDMIEVANISFNNDSEFEAIVLRSNEVVRLTGSIEIYSYQETG